MICFLLVMSTLAVYWQVQHHDFVNYDDDKYVTENRHIQGSFTLEKIAWAFTAKHVGNWHPLTWLSHMLDYQLFGLNPGRHHLTNLCLHLANTLLVFFFFRKMTGAPWQSGFVAALFALHPLHVSSVAWVSERKDVLSTFWGMLTMWSYLWYVKHPGLNRYLCVSLFLALGLMSKAMLVTLPFVLLLIDYWPLWRWRTEPSNRIGSSRQWPVAFYLFLEKIPLIILATTSGVVTLLAEREWGAAISLDVIPIRVRIGNALVSYVNYIVKMIWPSNMAVFYPLNPESLQWWQIAGSCLLLAAISLLALRVVRQRPYFTVGWLWYLGTLIPVIGLVQIGSQSMADRYTYIPLIGLFVIVAWGVPDLAARWRHREIWLATSATFLLLILMVVSFKQVGYWKNSITLYEHTLKVTSNNYIIHYNLGMALVDEGQVDAAIDHYLQALRIKPDCVEARNNLSLALAKQGRLDEAIDHYLQALRIKPDFEKAHYNLGLAFSKQGQTDKAVYHYLEALRIKPDYKQAHVNLGVALERQGRMQDAVDHYLEALRIEPEEGTYNNLGNALEKQGRINAAIYHYLQALWLNPDYVDAHYNLGIALDKIGRIDKAVHHYSEALRIKPDFAEAHNNLGIVLEKKGRLDEAIVHYLQALRIKPDFDEAHNNLGIALFLKGDTEGAVDHFREALRIKPDHVSANMNLKNILMKPRQDK